MGCFQKHLLSNSLTTTILLLQVVFEDGEVDEMVWVQLWGYLHKPKKNHGESREVRRAKNTRRRERAQEDDQKMAQMKAKRARYDDRRKRKVEEARKAPSKNLELLERINEKNKAKRARKK